MKAGKPSRRLDVPPFLSQHDLADGGLVQSVLGGDGSLGHLRVQPANGPDVVLGQFGERMRHAMWMATLAALVFVVVGHRAYEQVRRIATGRIVAAVEHVLACWHWSINAFISHAMCSKLPALVFAGDDSVTLSIHGASPWPAGVGFSGLVVVEKPFGQWAGSSRVAAGFRAKRTAVTAYWQQAAM